MENDNIETPETTTLGIEMGKAFLVSAAATAGTFAAMVAVGAIINKTQDFAHKRKIQKLEKKEAKNS